MIISHRHKYIFLKTAKTAGTSIEIALSKHCGPDDVIASQWYSPEDQQTVAELGYPGPQNYLIPMKEYTARDWARLVRHPFNERKRAQFYNHMPAVEAKARIPSEIWDSYFKFCVCRNPWDRLISLYYWKSRQGSVVSADDTASIERFVESQAVELMTRRGWNLYTIDDEVVVDHVCRFENLADELAEIGRRLDLPEPVELPRAKSKHRSDKRPYREVLNDELREFVARTCAKEIAHFGYEF